MILGKLERILTRISTIANSTFSAATRPLRATDSGGAERRPRFKVIRMEETESHFEQSCLPHLDAAYNLARWLVGTDQDAQDIVQEAYIRALKGFKGFRGGNARAW